MWAHAVKTSRTVDAHVAPRTGAQASPATQCRAVTPLAAKELATPPRARDCLAVSSPGPAPTPTPPPIPPAQPPLTRPEVHQHAYPGRQATAHAPPKQTDLTRPMILNLALDGSFEKALRFQEAMPG
eukprot:gene16413-22622_t